MYMLHYYPRHVSSINMPIFRRTNCIHTACGIVALSKRLYSTPVESRLYDALSKKHQKRKGYIFLVPPISELLTCLADFPSNQQCSLQQPFRTCETLWHPSRNDGTAPCNQRTPEAMSNSRFPLTINIYYLLRIFGNIPSLFTFTWSSVSICQQIISNGM